MKRGASRLPYFIRSKDGNNLLVMAGLYDCVTLEGV
jgi:putative SOS response-associated peptidase YedK